MRLNWGTVETNEQFENIYLQYMGMLKKNQLSVVYVRARKTDRQTLLKCKMAFENFMG